jgi:hypothetical protein
VEPASPQGAERLHHNAAADERLGS